MIEEWIKIEEYNKKIETTEKGQKGEKDEFRMENRTENQTRLRKTDKKKDR